METLVVNSTNSHFVRNMYEIASEEKKNNGDEDITIALIDMNEEGYDYNNIRTHDADKWITFGDMINLLLEDYEKGVLKFYCKNFDDGDFIGLDTSCSQCLRKFNKQRDRVNGYIPSFEEMFVYMWKEV